MIDVLAFGDIVLDLIIPIEHFPIKEEDVQIAQYIKREAGGVCNFLIAASKLGLKAGITGCIGDDEDGIFIKDLLDKEGVDVTSINVIKGDTAIVLVLVDKDGKHAFIGVHGFGIELCKSINIDKIKSSKAIYTSGHTLIRSPSLDLTLKVMKKASDLGIPVFFDPGPLVDKIQHRILDTALASTDTLLLNSIEAEALTKTHELEKASKILLEKGVKTIVIKLGANGCFIAKEDFSIHLPSFKVPVIDTTGAGDSFNAAYIYGYLKKLPINHIGIIANAVGAIKVTRLGGGTQAPSRKELVDFLRRQKIDINIDQLVKHLELEQL
ncbi:MAG: carbohydrate kinase family protein [archaeon]|nr:carbohydrate kinase family protein [archaeon]MCP8314134.1 carbohydrate kinase family protein [archaeon]